MKDTRARDIDAHNPARRERETEQDQPETHRTNHTPTPWTYHSGSVYANGTRIALMDRETTDTSPTERDSNAKMIVKAVNAYRDPDQVRMREEARTAEALRSSLNNRKKEILFAFEDIRNVLRDQNHSGTDYEQEKLTERDRLLTEWHAIHRQLDFIG